MNLEAFQLSGALHVADGSVGFNAHYRGRGEILYSAKLCFCFHCAFIDQLFSRGPLTVTCREESGLLLRLRRLCDSVSFSYPPPVRLKRTRYGQLVLYGDGVCGFIC